MKFNLTIPKQSKIHEAYIGDFAFSRTSLDDHNDTYQINLGLVRYGQSLDFAIMLSKGFNLDYYLSFESNNQCFTSQIKNSADHDSKSDFVEIQLRMETIQTILAQIKMATRLKDIDGAKKVINELICKYVEVQCVDPVFKGILENLRDQISIAFSQHDYFKKWGNHYLRSFVRSL